jgi:ATP-dependent helicase YprA (DUF1998 family)
VGTSNPLAPSSARAAARAPELDALIQPAKEQALTEALTRLGAGRDVMRPFDASDTSLDLAEEHLRDEEYRVSADEVVTAVRRIPAAAAQYAPWPDGPGGLGVDSRLVDALRAKGIEQLYTHQAEAMTHALAGRNVVIITPTASGKTLCYNGPVLSSILRDPSSRALYLFPTKALAQDQLA